jgi:acyl-CoA reductase-like NAD-dependent aldehyde dehydrogenase
MVESRAAAVQELRARFAAGQTRPAEWRAAQLRGVLRMATEMEAEICDALHADLGKPKTEAHVHEVRQPASTRPNFSVTITIDHIHTLD